EVFNENEKDILNQEFQDLTDSLKVNGAILVYDPQQNIYYSNNFDWANRGKLPASTFKIPNSIIALETGIVEDDSTFLKWKGKKREYKVWEQDLRLRDAFHFSCVPCYKEIAIKIAPERMEKYLSDFIYGNIKVDSATIDNFWLEGESKISQRQEIDFLKRFYFSNLPVSSRTEKIVKRMIVVEKNELYTLSAKTGWSIYNGINNLWYVGYVETGGEVYFFAINFEPKQGVNPNKVAKARKQITLQALNKLNIININ
ncbi:class D beta-lactamase, partial [Xanthovirga aplysinae]|uniref:class D beta-lactamase n=1 Tax=Xanthovirga aplysinae TaxID=2529853 RepID=UPI0012BCD134